MHGKKEINRKEILYKKIKTKSVYYLYDTHSSKIFKLQKPIFENFDKYLDWITKGIKPDSKKDNFYLQFYDFVKNNNLLHNNNNKVIENPDTEKLLLSDRSRLTLDLTNKCNNRCEYCVYSGKYSNHRTHQDISMTYEIGCKAIKDFYIHSKDSPIISITFYGGEPLLEFALIKLLYEYAVSLDNRFIFSLSTNGLLLTEPIIDWLSEKNFGIQVSIDGPKEIHDRYRKDINGFDTYERIINNLKIILKKHPDFFRNKISIVITLCPPIKLKQIYDWYRNDFTKQFNLSSLVTNVSIISDRDIDLKNHWILNPEEFTKDLYELKKNFLSKLSSKNIDPVDVSFFNNLVTKEVVNIHNRVIRNLNKNVSLIQMGCIPGHAKTFVSVDGSYYPCERVNYTFKIGDVNKGIDLDVIHKLQEKFRKFTKQCKECWAKRLCQTCYSTICEKQDFDENFFLERCNHIKSEIENSLFFYCSIMENNPDFLNGIIDARLSLKERKEF